jgi:hypothetical protein
MDWPIDKTPRSAANDFPLSIAALQPSSQYDGKKCNPAGWQDCLRKIDTFPQTPAGLNPDSPSQIISEFKSGHYLPALALTISWGGMWRTKQRIYAGHDLDYIHRTLEQCAQSISGTSSIRQAWQLLTGEPPGLKWSSVMTSKTLHFLSRALDFTQRPPVPVDGEVVRQGVWPKFRDGVPADRRPQNWNGDTFEAYGRYMTAIIAWAEKKNWTTTETEATIFAEYQGSINR